MIVFDIDGVLADCRHRLIHIHSDSPDWTTFYEEVNLDPPIMPVVRLFQMLSLARSAQLKDAVQIEFWTGRSEVSRSKTTNWLGHHLGPEAARLPIRMRPEGDHRPAHELKREFMDHFGRPDLIFEDTPSVVRMFRSQGVPVAQMKMGVRV